MTGQDVEFVMAPRWVERLALVAGLLVTISQIVMAVQGVLFWH